MTDEPETTEQGGDVHVTPEDPIERMPPQLREANRRRKAGNTSAASMPGQPDNNAPPPWAEQLLGRIERMEQERYSSQFVEHEPEPKANPRVADPASFSDFTRKLLEQTKPTPPNYGGDREPQYNVPMRWFLHADGRYVQLQGDARNVRYYQDKGLHLLDKDEERHYLDVERPKILREQRHKANLITSIRKLIGREATLSGYDGDQEWDASLDLMSIARLEEEWSDLCRQTAVPNRKLPSPPRYKSDTDPSERLLAGVEVNGSETPESLERKRRGQGRSVEVTAANANQFA